MADESASLADIERMLKQTIQLLKQQPPRTELALATLEAAEAMIERMDRPV